MEEFINVTEMHFKTKESAMAFLDTIQTAKVLRINISPITQGVCISYVEDSHAN